MGRASGKKKAQQAARRARPDLLVKLAVQRDLLGHLTSGFDEGKVALALPLAVVVRVLLHDTNKSASLLGQLQLKDRLKFEDTAQHIDPNNLLPTNFGLTVARMTAGVGGGWEAALATRPPVPPVPFGAWWKTPILRDANRRTWSRWQIISQVANKEGGAHLDPEVDLEVLDLEERNSMGLTFTDPTVGNGVPFENGPLLPSVRQIAFEVDRTLAAAETNGLLR